MHKDDDNIAYNSVGKPITGIEYKIEDGELLVTSQSMYSGYLNSKIAMS